MWLTDKIWLDGATAALVGANILYTGWKLVSHAFAGLMDASDLELLEEIATVLKEHRKSAWIDIHRLRARRAGERLYVDFHLILPQDFSLEQATRKLRNWSRSLKPTTGIRPRSIFTSIRVMVIGNALFAAMIPASQGGPKRPGSGCGSGR